MENFSQYPSMLVLVHGIPVGGYGTVSRVTHFVG